MIMDPGSEINGSGASSAGSDFFGGEFLYKKFTVSTMALALQVSQILLDQL